MDLFCFSYAGGDAHNFKAIENTFKDHGINLKPYNYRGRGARIKENQYVSIKEIASEAVAYIIENCHNKSYGLLGCSMGSIVAIEIYYELESRGYPTPNIIFACSALPPHAFKVAKYNQAALVDELIKMGGVNADVLKFTEFYDYFLPIIEKDFNLCHNYKFEGLKSRIKSKLVVVYGSEDNFDKGLIAEWKEYSYQTNICMVPGNHFFLFNTLLNFETVFVCSS